MIGTLTNVLRRLILWDFPRGSWQYDLIVIAIVAFLFLTPKSWFRDQPRVPHSSQIASLPSHGESVFWVEPELVSSIPEPERLQKLSGILSTQRGKAVSLTRVEPIYDSEQELKGFMAFAKP